MHELVAALRCGGWRLHGPEHSDTQGERHGERERDVEVLAHANRLTAPGAERKQMPSPGVFAVKWKAALNQALGGSDKGQGLGR